MLHNNSLQMKTPKISEMQQTQLLPAISRPFWFIKFVFSLT